MTIVYLASNYRSRGSPIISGVKELYIIAFYAYSLEAPMEETLRRYDEGRSPSAICTDLRACRIALLKIFVFCVA